MRFFSRLARAGGLAPSLFVQPFSGTAAAPQAGFPGVCSCHFKRPIALGAIVVGRRFPFPTLLAPRNGPQNSDQ
jgi:hypothetical protein